MCNLRLCKRCGEFKELSKFKLNRKSDTKTTYKRYCIDCVRSKENKLDNLDSYEILLYERIFLESGQKAFDISLVDHSKNQVCLKCGQIKDLNEFRLRLGKKNTTYRCHHCKSCEAYYTNKWRKLNPERALEYTTYYRKSGKSKENYINLAHRNLKNHLLLRAKHNAKSRNLDFNLELEDIIIPEKCPYLEIPLTNNVGKTKTGLKDSYSIDRIDSKKGYIKGNVQIISRLANTMKNEASIEELITFSKNVLKIHNKNKDEDIV